ncbi:MAG TPA: phosphopantetheine-binding protein [Methanoculleus sp.]|jgi:acyl carrier protein|uniref:acyl carrier protein n=1 Tax=Methanoculleus sp. TaxID=90427 RepID=UPI000AF0FA6A|nr:phosphopantetheine-binding protein [Methanoculleus sp.]HPW10878.1 phosphopantetheine-binding protein [Methanoregulaceae archaeon]MBP7143815.1 hypothetical protein [Methanoculleus sp.]HNQ33424.1 phosphopantetheine-binding protein [Methanoculleus sp.]HOC83027.1 phosphopantetheine-binding protein [Methanoculleus sp.]HOF95958.1 phosphopantetheine-binding protein [Methanoculleus sp.]
MDESQIEKTLREILARRVPNAPIDKLTLDAPLAALGIDSLAYSWILADTEDTFGFVMMGSDVMKLKTLKHTIEYVQTQIEKKG